MAHGQSNMWYISAWVLKDKSEKKKMGAVGENSLGPAKAGSVTRREGRQMGSDLRFFEFVDISVEDDRDDENDTEIALQYIDWNAFHIRFKRSISNEQSSLSFATATGVFVRCVWYAAFSQIFVFASSLTNLVQLNTLSIPFVSLKFNNTYDN